MITVHTYTMTVPCDSVAEAREVVARLRKARIADVWIECGTKAGHSVRLVRGTDTVA
jgi:hypothetical protein